MVGRRFRCTGRWGTGGHEEMPSNRCAAATKLAITPRVHSFGQAVLASR
jgi:hypothetical protein